MELIEKGMHIKITKSLLIERIREYIYNAIVITVCH